MDWLYWAREREGIRLRREAGRPGPWTDDPILRNHHFCNVSREDDKTTRWIKEHIREPFENSDRFVEIMVFTRMINLPFSLGRFIEEGVISDRGIDLLTFERVYPTLPEGKRVSCAYITQSSLMARRGLPRGKVPYLKHVIGGIPRELPSRSRRLATATLAECDGLGFFLAGQVVADLSHTVHLRDANDHMDYAPMGPGSRRGVRRALGLTPKGPLSEDEYLKFGRSQVEVLGREEPELLGRLHLHDVVSNINCETDKYIRVRNGEGTTRRYLSGFT